MTEEKDAAAPPGASDPSAADAQAEASLSVTTDAPGGTGAPRRRPSVWVRNRIRHAVVPWAAIEDVELSDRDFRTLAVLCLYQDAEGKAWPGTARFAVVGSENTFRRALKSLKATGWVSAEYDRRAHRITYEVQWEHPSNVRGAPLPKVRAAPPPDLGLDRSTDHTATDQQPAAVPAASSAGNGKPDTARARAFLTRYLGWYQRVYGRAHATPTAREVFQVAAFLKRVERDRDRQPEMERDETAEEIVGSAATCAVRDRHTHWFLRDGQPLDLRVVMRHWPALWDRILKGLQEMGEIPSGEIV